LRFALVSDLHIAGPGCPRQAAFLRFLSTVECDRLYLCGDVFEHWWHWGERPFDQYRPVVDALARFSLRVLPGNHDWLAPEFFQRVLGAGVGAGGVLREDWGGASAVVAHGDQADRSAGYALACAVLRGPVFRAVVDRMGNDQAWRFLGRLTGHGEVRANPGLIAAQEAWAAGQGADIVVWGHTHAPRLAVVDGRAFANIGDGVAHGTWVEFDSGRGAPDRLRLREFASPLQDRA